MKKSDSPLARGLLLWATQSLLLLLFADQVAAAPVELFGVNYNTRQGPDWDPNRCKSRDRIVTDLTMLKRITNRIRLLSMTDCNSGEIVLEVAKELGMQLWLGLWLSNDNTNNLFAEELSALENLVTNNLIDETTVLGVTVGSEAILRGDVTLEENIEFKNQVKNMLVQNGWSDLPVSIVDISAFYRRDPSFIESVDVIYANNFPFWANVPLNEAASELQSDVTAILNLREARNKRFIIGETGWPAAGSARGISNVGSPEGQLKYFQDFYCLFHVQMGFEYYWFTGIDNAWRQIQDPDDEIEGTWGFLNADLEIKPHFENLSFVCNDGVEYTFTEIDWTIPTDEPTSFPTATPSATPTNIPSSSPTKTPTALPIMLPTSAPAMPTVVASFVEESAAQREFLAESTLAIATISTVVLAFL